MKLLPKAIILLLIVFSFLNISCEVDLDLTKSYTVTFDTMGGNKISEQIVEKGKYVTNPSGLVSRTGYYLDGWYKDINLYDPWSFYTDTVKANITLYAGWTPIPAPGIPLGVTATAASSSSITISWYSVTGAAGYRIYRSTSSSGIFSEIGISYSTSYTNTGLNAGATYYYRVAAYNNSGTGALSTIVNAATLGAVPGVPTGVTATAESSNSITISWNSVTGATGYIIYRSASSSGTYSDVGTSTSSPLTDTGLAAGTTYYYKVAAYNNNGTGAQSGYVSAETTSSGGGSRNITVLMRDSYGNDDGWNGAMLDISVNNEYFPGLTISEGYNTNTFAFDANTGDVIRIYWYSGSYDDECAFAVYYTDDPPSPAFNPLYGLSNDTSKLLVYRLYGGLGIHGELLGTFTVSSGSTGSTTIFSEDFEGTNSFTIVNGSQTNQWRVGTATAYGGTRSAYISSNSGTSNIYDIYSSSTVHMYRNVTFPVSSTPFTLSFYWKAYGESSFDYLNVYLVESTTTITAGNTPSGILLGTYNLSGTFWNYATISVPVSNSGTTKRLVFTWINDNSSGTAPPAAVDNILLTR